MCAHEIRQVKLGYISESSSLAPYTKSLDRVNFTLKIKRMICTVEKANLGFFLILPG